MGLKYQIREIIVLSSNVYFIFNQKKRPVMFTHPRLVRSHSLHSGSLHITSLFHGFLLE